MKLENELEVWPFVLSVIVINCIILFSDVSISGLKMQ